MLMTTPLTTETLIRTHRWPIGLVEISEQNIGWAKQVNELLASWSLEQEWQVIQGKTVREWKTEVEYAAELAKKNKILQECETKYRGERKQKTKTKHVESIVNHAQYQRKPDDLLSRNKTLTFARALIMGRYGMLDCASNYSIKYGRKLCRYHNVNYVVIIK